MISEVRKDMLVNLMARLKKAKDQNSFEDEIQNICDEIGSYPEEVFDKAAQLKKAEWLENCKKEDSNFNCRVRKIS